ncbi:hypothetical protein MSAN_01732700 [Mycena sanguinolenta]|uniref:DUF6533 domain-containing protein n=1 Tax=Mycena sanguinolenta TaxID=230812 RepID=A0A8H6XWC5_9AGAR|nr:hypothetical protein MSAN_01732700 [Mycena sanguinolenta]
MADHPLSPTELQNELAETSTPTLLLYLLRSSSTITFLTVDDEISVYWRTRTTWASVLFYINRYLSLVGNAVPMVMQNFWATPNFNPHKVQVCRGIGIYHQYFAIVAQIFVAALLIMRTYALYERSRIVLFFTSGIALAAVVVGAYIIFSGKGTSDDLTAVYLEVGCASGLHITQSRSYGFGWIGMLVFDIAIFSLTAWKAWAHSMERRGPSLFTILIRDGAIFFFVMMSSNGGNILSFFYAGPYTRGVATAFTNVLSSVMISRLMLNLRTHAFEGSTIHTAESTTLYNPPISTVVEPYYHPDSNHFANSMLPEDIQLDDLRRGDP